MKKGEQKEKKSIYGVFHGKRFRISVFSILVLVFLAFLIIKTGDGAASVLFNQSSEITLYAKTAVGMEPQLNAAKYFPEEELEPSKFTYDLAGCDINTPGIYKIPVLYDQKLTDCVIELEVLQAKNEKPFLTGGDGLSLESGKE